MIKKTNTGVYSICTFAIQINYQADVSFVSFAGDGGCATNIA